MRLAHHENKEENVVLEDSASHRLNQRIMHSEPEDVILVASTSYGRRCKKIHLRKRRLESKLRGKYVLNLVNEPQHLAEIKTLKLVKISNKGARNLRERKLKSN